MAYDITIQTLDRSLSLAHEGQSLEEGANYLKGRTIKDWVLWIVTLGVYNRLAEGEIKVKKNELKRHSPDLIKNIINAPRTPHGYACSVTINSIQVASHRSIGGHTQFNINYDTASATVSFGDGNKLITHQNFSFDKLRRELLEQHLKMQREEGNSAIDLSLFNLSDIDLRGVDLSGILLNRQSLQAVIRSKGDLSGTRLTEDIDITDLEFKDVRMDREILAKLILLKADLKGVDLSDRQDLDGMPLLGLDLTGANFRNTNLKSAKFNGTKLENANFTDTNLEDASFIKADLTNIITNDKSNFNGADLRMANVGDMLRDITPDKRQMVVLDIDQIMNMRGKNILLRHANVSGDLGISTNSFANQNLSGTDFSDTYWGGGTNLKGTDFTDAKLVNADLSNVKMDAHTNLTNTDLTGANFYDVDLRQVAITATTKITNIRVKAAKLNHEWVEAAIRQKVTSLQGANLENVDLSGLDLSQIDLTGVNLKGALLVGTKLNRSGVIAAINSREVKNNLDQRITVDLRGIDISGTAANPHQLSDINFCRADLRGANLDYCAVRSSSFDECNLTGVNLQKTLIIGAGPAKKITVSEFDRAPFVEQLRNRLHFIFSGEKNGPDPFYSILPSIRLTLYKSMLFPVTQITSNYGDTNSDNGAQKMVLGGKLDKRHISDRIPDKEGQKVALKRASQKLFGDEFTEEQKILFHWSRAIMWKAIASFNAMAAQNHPAVEANRISEGDVLMDVTFKGEIYLRNDEFGRSMNQQALDVCFNAALRECQHMGHKLGNPQIGYVYELFTSRDYSW